MAKQKLTRKQETFCIEYLVDRNATQAAIRAGYSKKTAEQQGSRLLSNVKVQREIDRRQNKIVRRVEITAEEVLSIIIKEAKGEFQKGTAIDTTPAARLAAATLLAKITGLLDEKDKLKDGEKIKEKEIVLDLSKVPTEELMKFLGREKKPRKRIARSGNFSAKH